MGTVRASYQILPEQYHPTDILCQLTVTMCLLTVTTINCTLLLKTPRILHTHGLTVVFDASENDGATGDSGTRSSLHDQCKRYKFISAVVTVVNSETHMLEGYKELSDPATSLCWDWDICGIPSFMQPFPVSIHISIHYTRPAPNNPALATYISPWPSTAICRHLSVSSANYPPPTANLSLKPRVLSSRSRRRR